MLKTKELVYYSVLLDKLELSIKNNWKDKEGRVFIRLKDETAAGILNCSLSTVTKIKKNLNELGLISWDNIGKRKANLIYVNKQGETLEPLELLKQKFIRLHKFLFKWEELSNLSIDAKVLFCLLVDATDFSFDNGLIDEHGTYVIFDREKIMRIVNVSKNTATKVIKELESIGLIKTVQQFIGENKRIYVQIPNELLHKTNKEVIISQESHDPNLELVNPKCMGHQAQNIKVINPKCMGLQVQKIKVINSKCTCHQAQNIKVTSSKNTGRQAQKLGTNNTLFSNTLFSNSLLSNHHHQDYSFYNQKELKMIEHFKTIYDYKNLIMRYDTQIGKLEVHEQTKELVDKVIESLAITLSNNTLNVSVGQDIILKDLFYERILKASSQDICELCNKIDAFSQTIQNFDGYVRTVLWDILDRGKFNNEIGEKLRRKEITFEEFEKAWKR